MLMTVRDRKRGEVLDVKPVRSPDAVLERRGDGGALVKVPITGRWPFRMPKGATKSFELDEMGLFVWDSCDGRATLLDVITKFARHYRISVREAEVATTKFVQMLAARRLIRIGGEDKP